MGNRNNLSQRGFQIDKVQISEIRQYKHLKRWVVCEGKKKNKGAVRGVPVLRTVRTQVWLSAAHPHHGRGLRQHASRRPQQVLRTGLCFIINSQYSCPSIIQHLYSDTTHCASCLIACGIVQISCTQSWTSSCIVCSVIVQWLLFVITGCNCSVQKWQALVVWNVNINRFDCNS